jgi:hypothetical protein
MSKKKKPYFYAADTPQPDTVKCPIKPPCVHRHRTLDAAKKCATKNSRDCVFKMDWVLVGPGTCFRPVLVHRLDYIGGRVRIEYYND